MSRSRTRHTESRRWWNCGGDGTGSNGRLRAIRNNRTTAASGRWQGMCHVRSSGSLQKEIPQTQKTVRLEYVRRRYSFSVNKSGVWVVRKRGWQCRRSGREALNRFTESVCRGIKPGGTTGTSFSLLSQQFRNSILPGQEFFVFPGEGADMIRKHRYWRTAD